MPDPESRDKKGRFPIAPLLRPGVAAALLDKRTVGNRIVKRQNLLQMRPGRGKLASIDQVPTGGGMTQNEPSHVVMLTAQTQQIRVQALRQIELAAVYVIEG